MIKELNLTNRKIVEDILKVQIPSYLVEAELIGYSDIPPLKDTVATLQKCGETFYGYYIEDELSGAISIKIEQGIIDIHRLIVHPRHFRKGIAKGLLSFIEDKEKSHLIKVATGSKNMPAVTFYQKNGFLPVEEVRVNNQLTLTRFEKRK